MAPWAFPGDVAGIAAQIGSSLEPDNAAWFNRFTVKSSSSDKVYVVAQRRTDGTWGCSCWGWKRHRHCKHLDDILARLARVQPEAQFDAGILTMLASAKKSHEGEET